MTYKSGLAKRLAHAALQNRSVIFRPDDILASLDEAEAIQDAMVAEMDMEVAGWKIGASTHVSRQALGLSRNFSAPLGKHQCLHAPGSLKLIGARPWGVECEIAIIGKHDYAPGSVPLRMGELAANMVLCAPAFEFPQCRFAALGAHGPEALVADNGAAGFLAIGSSVEMAEINTLDDLITTLFVNDTARASGGPGALLMNPLDLFADHVNRMTARGYTISAGQSVLTGSLTPFVPISVGETLRADFGPLGMLEMETQACP